MDILDVAPTICGLAGVAITGFAEIDCSAIATT
jgi:hypothetical protein